MTTSVSFDSCSVAAPHERERGPDLLLRQRPVAEQIEVDGAAVSEMQ